MAEETDGSEKDTQPSFLSLHRPQRYATLPGKQKWHRGHRGVRHAIRHGSRQMTWARTRAIALGWSPDEQFTTIGAKLRRNKQHKQVFVFPDPVPSTEEVNSPQSAPFSSDPAQSSPRMAKSDSRIGVRSGILDSPDEDPDRPHTDPYNPDTDPLSPYSSPHISDITNSSSDIESRPDTTNSRSGIHSRPDARRSRPDITDSRTDNAYSRPDTQTHSQTNTTHTTSHALAHATTTRRPYPHEGPFYVRVGPSQPTWDHLEDHVFTGVVEG